MGLKHLPLVNIVILLFSILVGITLGGQSVATLALGSRPRLRGCKVAGQEEGSPGIKAKALQECGPRGSPGAKARGSPGVTSHTPGSVRMCEGV